jgi:hypothetical protein
VAMWEGNEGPERGCGARVPYNQRESGVGRFGVCGV